ncbi:piggyBac transposable element-derived protein 3-like [Macrosteles quadrilineatus]|uniref:piggyBac transposable element-derived protein 3-like n=1 Tax=Macrosteles quadrilineatus TaxID=74068 RepID=UPI0023E1BD6B|nr:piggyBac transposable element-derived protein 3-like [Macrosteles quadrilineatus]
MADREFQAYPSSTQRVLEEFCDNYDFSELTDVEDLSDDDDGRSIEVSAPPRIDILLGIEEDQDLLEEAVDEPDEVIVEQPHVDEADGLTPTEVTPTNEGNTPLCFQPTQSVGPVPGPSGENLNKSKRCPAPSRVSSRKRAKVGLPTKTKKPRAERRKSIRPNPREQTLRAMEPLPTNGKWEVSNNFYPLPPAPYFGGHNPEYNMSSPLDLFQKYIPDDILCQIATATNENIISSTGKEIQITTTDMKKFFGITIMMSYLKYPRIKMYWASRTRIPQISDAMPRNKYFLIRNHIRCRDYTNVSDEEKARNKYWKVSPVIDSVRASCLLNPRPNEVSMDEQMVPFWGHTQMRQHIKGKPNPCGLKNLVVCAPDGLPLDFFLYEGKGDSILHETELNYPGLDIGGKIIVRLSKNLPQGTSIFMDRYFTSIQLLDELHIRGFQGTGTLINDRMPENREMYSDAEVRGGGRGYMCQIVRDDGQIAIVKWFDNKPVLLTSSIHGCEPKDVCRRWCKKEKRYVQVERPYIIKKYNECMGGVDLLDRMISYYRIAARTKKWTTRLISHLIDFSLAAGWIERRRADQQAGTPRRDRFDFFDFRFDVAQHLLASETEEPVDDEEIEDDPQPLTSSSGRKTPLPTDAVRKSKVQHLPEIPPDVKPSRCRFPGCDSPKCALNAAPAMFSYV